MPTPTLIDEALPAYDVAERHATDVAAPPERVWAAGRALDLRGSPLIRVLFALRSLPGLFSRRRAGGAGLGLDRAGLERSGFVVLGERENEELLLGLVGRFWTPTGGIVRVGAGEWRDWERPGYAKAAWNFTLAPLPDGRTRLVTETRVRCTDEASRRSFLRYWRVVGPFSGLIRREMLRGIRKSASFAEPAGGNRSA